MGQPLHRDLSDSLMEFTEGEIVDADVEVFELFSRNMGSHDLGMFDAHAQTLDLCIAGKDVTIHQSPGVLTSNRTGGTTGAVVWRMSIPFAEWISSTSNVLFQTSILNPSSTVLELGAGVGLVGLFLAPQVQQYIMTDQEYMLKLMNKNIQKNRHLFARDQRNSSRTSPGPRSRNKASKPNNLSQGRVTLLSLDWETDEASGLMNATNNTTTNSQATRNNPDVVLACDCIFNESLIEPFVQLCSKVCSARSFQNNPDDLPPTVCIIAQQLRSPTIFETWLHSMMRRFRLWRISASSLPESLGEDSIYVIHLAIARQQLASTDGL